jgi:hypothetical protein
MSARVFEDKLTTLDNKHEFANMFKATIELFDTGQALSRADVFFQ